MDSVITVIVFGMEIELKIIVRVNTDTRHEGASQTLPNKLQ